ncbi:hypothetical protein AURDEDRAFT_164291 [Auricularia subglabra TFB-10046 SS5]|nr:hypothetical protein AURDEDRAFT_164291 [Auricularia subglabra TFB-10046 SS5]
MPHHSHATTAGDASVALDFTGTAIYVYLIYVGDNTPDLEAWLDGSWGLSYSFSRTDRASESSYQYQRLVFKVDGLSNFCKNPGGL